jgi:chromosome partitioning protein
MERPMPAHLIVVAGTKGGTGKSTTASNLLVAARLAGIDAVGLDLDPQGSLATWAGDRASRGREPAVAVLPGRLTGWRDTVTMLTARLAILDLAPGLDEEREALALQDLARVARLTLIPALAEGPSVRKLADVGAALRRAGAQVAFVMNKTIAGRAILADARAYLGRRGELLPVEIPQRDAVHRAMDQGFAVVENPAFGGCQEYRELWRLVSVRLGLTAAEAA